MSRMFTVAGLAALAIAAASQAAVVTTSSQAAFNAITNQRGLTRASFGFSQAPAAYAQLEGGTAWNAWTMVASAGQIRVTDAGKVRTEDANRSIRITFAPGAFAVGGNFFCGDVAGAAVPGSQVRITLDSGQSYVANSSTTSFAGFISDIAIASITIERQVAGSDPLYASVGNLVVAGVPAPGSIALLGAAGLAGTRRRRR